MAFGIGFAQAGAFVGTVGTAVNSNGWQTHSGAPGQIVITAGSLTYPGLTSQGNKTQTVSTNAEDINLSGFTPLTSNVYYSGLINPIDITGLANNGTVGNYFLSTGTTGGTTGVTVFNARLYIKQGVNANTIKLGVLNGPGGTSNPTYSNDLPLATTYFVVIKYNFTTNTASLWVNPGIGSTESTPLVTNNTGTTVAPASIASLCIRQSSPTTGNVEIDELRIGDSWSNVTSSILGVSQNSISDFSIYPNPVTNGVFYITTDTNIERAVTIFDILGKQVLNTTIHESAINVSGLNPGVYLVQVTEEGDITTTRKLIVR